MIRVHVGAVVSIRTAVEGMLKALFYKAFLIGKII
jgi:hypothetical protein